MQAQVWEHWAWGGGVKKPLSFGLNRGISKTGRFFKELLQQQARPLSAEQNTAATQRERGKSFITG